MRFTAVRAFRCLPMPALFAAVAACGGPEEIDGEVTSLVVRGAIEDAAGAPVAGAVVHVGWQAVLCDEPQPFPPDTTNAAGEFTVTAWSWGTYTEACVTVRAEPPVGAALQQAQVLLDRVTLTPRDGPDTLTLRLRLNPS
jgi:hypothetical protein